MLRILHSLYVFYPRYLILSDISKVFHSTIGFEITKFDCILHIHVITINKYAECPVQYYKYNGSDYVCQYYCRYDYVHTKEFYLTRVVNAEKIVITQV